MEAASTMTRDVVVVPPELTLASAWHVMTAERIRHLPVVRAGALIGMLSDRDVLVRATLCDDGIVVPTHVLVGEAMTPTPIETCEASTGLVEVVRTMLDKKIDAVPVVKGLRLVGLVTTTDLLTLLADGRAGSEPLPFRFRLVDDARAHV